MRVDIQIPPLLMTLFVFFGVVAAEDSSHAIFDIVIILFPLVCVCVRVLFVYN
jgi:hypothetical protein